MFLSPTRALAGPRRAAEAPADVLIDESPPIRGGVATVGAAPHDPAAIAAQSRGKVLRVVAPALGIAAAGWALGQPVVGAVLAGGFVAFGYTTDQSFHDALTR